MAGALLDKLVWVWLSVTSPVVPGEKKKNEVPFIKMQEFKSLKAHKTALKTAFLTEVLLYLPCILTDFTFSGGKHNF